MAHDLRWICSETVNARSQLFSFLFKDACFSESSDYVLFTCNLRLVCDQVAVTQHQPDPKPRKLKVTTERCLSPLEPMKPTSYIGDLSQSPYFLADEIMKKRVPSGSHTRCFVSQNPLPNTFCSMPPTRKRGTENLENGFPFAS
jgi:hypothetical protein